MQQVAQCLHTTSSKNPHYQVNLQKTLLTHDFHHVRTGHVFSRHS